MLPHDLEVRLRSKIRSLATGYPEAWGSGPDPDKTPFERLLGSLVVAMRDDPGMAETARRAGAKLRRTYNYSTPEGACEASADLRRGLAWLAIDILHKSDYTDLVAGDRLTPEQVAFYVADDLWMGHDDMPNEERPNIRRVREQLKEYALTLPPGEWVDLPAFAARFIARYQDVVHEAEWTLQLIGSGEGFADEVWAATRDNDLWRGVCFYAEGILANLSQERSSQSA